MKKLIYSALTFAMVVGGATVVESAIEPTVLFETVLAGYDLGHGTDIVTDEAGNAYVIAGYHSDATFNDILIAKVDPAGEILWERPIEGSEIDIAGGISMDGASHVVVVGYTDSPDFPVTADGFETVMAGVRDAFIIELSALDGTITYGTFLGATHATYGNDVAVAEDGTVWMVGSTDSTDYPTVNPLQLELGNYPFQYDDVVVSALAPDGQSLLYSTYLGGSQDDTALGIALREDGTIVVAGRTGSLDFPGIDGYQQTLNVGENDLFAAIIAADGSALMHATYLGGSGFEIPWGFDVGPDGAVYLAGYTGTEDFPTTPDSLQPDFVGEVNGCPVPFADDRNCYDGFLAHLGPDLATLEYSTYLGGLEDDVLDGVAVSADGEIHISGWTYSPGFPVTSGPSGPGIVAVQLQAGASEPDYAVTLDADGSSNSLHDVTLGPDGATVYVTGSRHNEPYVARMTGAGMIFADGFESADTSRWQP